MGHRPLWSVIVWFSTNRHPFWNNKTIYLITAVIRERQVLHISVLQQSTDANVRIVSCSLVLASWMEWCQRDRWRAWLPLSPILGFKVRIKTPTTPSLACGFGKFYIRPWFKRKLIPTLAIKLKHFPHLDVNKRKNNPSCFQTPIFL